MATLTLVIAIVALVASLAVLGLYFNLKWRPSVRLATKAELDAALNKVVAGLDAALKEKASKAWVEKNYTPDSSLAVDYATKEELTNGLANVAPADTSALERKVDGVVLYLKGLHALTVGRLRAPIDQEIAVLKAEIAESSRDLEPLEEAEREIGTRLAELRRAKLPEKASKAAIRREAERHVAGLHLDDPAAELNKMAEYVAHRDEIVQEQKDAIAAAEQEFEEASAEIAAQKASIDTSSAEAQLAELRAQLSTLEGVEQALAALNPPDPGTAGEDEIEDVPDLHALVAGLPPPTNT